MTYTVRAIIRNMAGEREDIYYGEFSTEGQANSFIAGEATYFYDETEWDIDLCSDEADGIISGNADLRERGFWLDDWDVIVLPEMSSR